MGAIIVPDRFACRRRTWAGWVANNEVLYKGELGIVSDAFPIPVSKTGDGTTEFLSLPVDDQQFAVGGGTANAVTATFVPPPVLYDGALYHVRAADTNTGAATFNPNGLGALAIKKNGGVALSAGDIADAGHELLLRYVAGSPGHFELLNPAGLAGVGAGSGAWTLVVKAADLSRASVVAVADDPDLKVSLAAASVYRLRFSIAANQASASVGFKFKINYTGATIRVEGRRWQQLATATGSTVALETALFDNFFSTVSAGTSYFEWEYIITTDTAGTLSFQWAQNTSSANLTTMRGGSFIEYLKAS